VTRIDQNKRWIMFLKFKTIG